MKSFFVEIYYGLYMIFIGLKRIKFHFIRVFKGKEAAFQYTKKVVSNWSIKTIKIIGMEIEVIGKDNIPKEACLFVSNHQSYFDVPALIYAIDNPIGFVAKKELEKIPVYKSWMLDIKSVFIDRNNAREAIKTINEGVQYLKEGYSMGIFPEGTRSKSKYMGEFKKGSLKLATKSKVPIVPISINGTYKAFEETGWLKRASVKIIIDKPIYTKDLTKEEENTLSDDLRNLMCKNLDI
ncbi:lysophospholipid acyltransferase family protein [Clostridium algidicarnis]|uniref:lysophospholipid acyltransferase family protein n=1 Tax=Clostridium algidicarnis TaxID=37659 RepID=UPI001C0C6A63|nr:lysophospholipid acyltransferase family protein [Clostridium algidicarnis]MBU3195227.1 1-acyl-sn-glycerol-3-phosphate acyltransferase [Clostridium algidicarnis]MBU3208186.1 1-acyl-sn-glycerol-3-phosphate acyltransferase [Clostridium algidicarnis]MBU3227583.1 1-acyl-sn-glycerol-3-phosphate acyltransferase [Clostridium algidicarnis]MBU3251011.1 1-acyl-sn-glycerol-3-phosphate acyltransferase [Clostridium algidicarnis]